MNKQSFIGRLCVLSFLFFFTFKSYAQTFDLIGQSGVLKNKQQLDNKFNKYQIFTLDAKALSNYLRHGRTAKNVHVQLDAHDWHLVVRPNDIRTPQYQMVLGTDSGNKIYPADENVTYSARFENQAVINSALTIADDFINGYVREGDNYWFIEPARLFQPDAPQDAFVFYNMNDVKPFEGKCAVDHLGGKDKLPQTNGALQPELTPLACKQGAVAIAIDNDLYVAQGNSSETAKNVIFSVINNVNTLYATAFTDQIKFTITTVFVATTSAANPYSPTTATTDASILLNNFAVWGQAGNFGITSAVYDFGMVFTARDIDFSGSSATVGLAYRPGSCGSSLYQVDEYRNFPIAGMAAVTAHETGHNLNAVHDGAAGFIMSSSVNFSSPATTWSAASVTTINARYPSQACIANCTTLGTPAADFIATSPRGCVNTNITFTDLSTNEPTGWNWSFASGTPVSASTQNPTAQWSSPGNYTVGLTSTNSAGSSTPIAKNSYAQVIAAPSNPCSPTGATLGNLGITSFQLNTISNSSGDAATDGSNYLNLSCSQSTTLTPSTSYTGTIVLPQFAAIRVWIDYNDNTSFGDANELIHASANGVLWSGTYNFIFTTPASPSGSKLLRLRVRAYSNSFDSNPCSGYASATGQTEDYAVYFESVLPVELTQFSGKWQNDYAALTWQTATENQNKGFEIERSLDGKQFDKVGFVAAKGGNQTTDYWFNDYETSKNTTPQYIYYRLKQIDENGGYRYSKVILLATNHKVQWTVSPNPSKGLFNINTIQSANNTFDIDVVDMLGRSIYHQHKASVNANAPLSIDMSLIAAGVYILKISQPQQPLFVSRLVKN